MADIWQDKPIVTINLLGEEFLEAVKTGDSISIKEDGTVEVGWNLAETGQLELPDWPATAHPADSAYMRAYFKQPALSADKRTT